MWLIGTVGIGLRFISTHQPQLRCISLSALPFYFSYFFLCSTTRFTEALNFHCWVLIFDSVHSTQTTHMYMFIFSISDTHLAKQPLLNRWWVERKKIELNVVHIIIPNGTSEERKKYNNNKHTHTRWIHSTSYLNGYVAPEVKWSLFTCLMWFVFDSSAFSSSLPLHSMRHKYACKMR